MKLSKILKAICGRLIAPNSRDTPETAGPVPTMCHSTPIYDTHRTTYRAYPGENRNIQPLRNDDNSVPIPLRSYLRSHMPFVPAAPALPLRLTRESGANSTTLHELASDPSRSQDSINGSGTPDHEHIDTARQSFGQVLKRLSSENSRQQEEIEVLLAQLTIARRKAAYLPRGKILSQRRLKKQLAQLIGEIEKKEGEIRQWMDLHKDFMRSGRDSEDSAIRAVCQDMETSAFLLRHVCDDLRVKVEEVEKMKKVLDHKTRGMGMRWTEGEFDAAMLREGGPF